MFKPKPITKEEIVVGKRYIEVEVYQDGTIVLEKHTFLGKPILRKGGWWIRTRQKSRGESTSYDGLENFKSLRDLGIITNPNCNYHRTFLATRATERFLKRFVQERGRVRKFVSYLRFLGIENPSTKVAEHYELFVFFSTLYEGPHRRSI